MRATRGSEVEHQPERCARFLQAVLCFVRPGPLVVAWSPHQARASPSILRAKGSLSASCVCTALLYLFKGIPGPHFEQVSGSEYPLRTALLSWLEGIPELRLVQRLADLALRASQHFVHRELTERVSFVNHGCPDGERTIVSALCVLSTPMKPAGR